MSEKQRNRGVVLTISLLASNRKDTTKKCLESLQMIRKHVPSELIVVDTGCDSELNAILHEYADQVVKFNWCDDFSKARNVGLERASGQWFLYIDDDEWFEDSLEIVEFFQSKEYKKYGAACYRVRNYADYEEKKYADTWVARMVCLEGGARFHGSIHEYLSPVTGAVKLLNSYVKHFGYVYRTKEELVRHARRNITPLLDMVSKEPLNIRWRSLLAKEYQNVGEYENLREVCIQGLQAVSRIDNGEVNTERGSLYCGCLLADLLLTRYKDGEADFGQAIADERNNAMTRARILYLGAQLYERLEKYDLCETYAKQYLELYEQLKDREDVQLEEGTAFVKEAFYPEWMNKAYMFLVLCGLSRKDDSVLETWFSKLGWQEEIVYVYEPLVERFITYVAAADFKDVYVQAAQSILDCPGTVKWAVDRVKELEESDLEAFRRLAAVLAGTESNDAYIWYLKIRNAVWQKNETALPKLYEGLLCHCMRIFQLKEIVWEIAAEYRVDLPVLFCNIPFDNWKYSVDSFFENPFREMSELLTNAVEKMQDAQNPRADYFLLKEAEAEMVQSSQTEDFGELRRQIECFVERCLSFYGTYYKESAFEGEMELLPGHCRGAICLKRVLEAEKQEDYKCTFGYLKACVGVYPPFDPVIKTYSHLYGERVKKEAQKQPENTKKTHRPAEASAQISGEMQVLAEKIKGSIRYLLEQQMPQEAQKTLQQLKTFVPEDEELKRLEYEIKVQLKR